MSLLTVSPTEFQWGYKNMYNRRWIVCVIIWVQSLCLPTGWLDNRWWVIEPMSQCTRWRPCRSMSIRGPAVDPSINHAHSYPVHVSGPSLHPLRTGQTNSSHGGWTGWIEQWKTLTLVAVFMRMRNITIRVFPKTIRLVVSSSKTMIYRHLSWGPKIQRHRQLKTDDWEVFQIFWSHNNFHFRKLWSYEKK